MVQFEGKYQHYKSEKFDEFLSAIGVPYIPRKIMSLSNPLVEVSKEGDDKWLIKMVTMIKTIEFHFTPGQPVQTNHMPMGGPVTNIFTFEDNKIKQVQTGPKHNTEVIREFNDDGMIMTLIHNETGTTSQRHFKRVLQ